MPTLTEAHVRNAKARGKPYKLFDELGLLLLVTPNADARKDQLWRLRYRYADVEKLLSEPVRFPVVAHVGSTDIKQHGEYRTASPGVHKGRNDRPRIPQHGEHIAK